VKLNRYISNAEAATTAKQMQNALWGINEITSRLSGTSIKGDANSDGVVDVADVDFVIEAIGGEYAKAADVNGDGAVDVADVDFIIEQIQ
jgi:hypothetical protein